LTEQNNGSPPRIEITLEVDYGDYRASVSGFLDSERDAKPLIAELTKAIAVVNASKTDIEKALKGVSISKPKTLGLHPAEPSTSEPSPATPLPSEGKAGILEFSEDDVRFPPSAFKVLGFPEAIALLMYEIGSPLMPARITLLINRGFKYIDAKNVSSCLTNRTRYKLPGFVIREKAGWRLTGSGRAWVENEIIPKLGPQSGGS